MPVELTITIIEYIAAVFTGLVLGSFATAITYREQRNIPWAFGGKAAAKEEGGMSPYRSACPSCKTRLGFRDLVPVFSWICLKGRCRHCAAKIGAQYPAMEIAVLAACLALYAVHGLSIPAFLMMLSVPFLAALLVIDVQQMLLPNRLVAAVGGLGAVHAAYLGAGLGQWPLFFNVVAAGILFGLIAWFIGWSMGKILQKEALGMGDVKFFAAAGIWLGLESFPWFCMIAGAAGMLLGLVWRLAGKGQVFPFGPALILSLYILFLLDSSFLIEIALK